MQPGIVNLWGRTLRIPKILIALLLFCNTTFAAVDFNGDADYISFGAVTGFPTGTSQRTACAWVNTDSFDVGTNDAAFGLSNDTGIGKFMTVYAEDNAFSIGMSGHRVISPKSTLSTGTWYYVCVVVPSGATTTANVKLYINGVNQTLSTEGGSSQTLNTGAVNIQIGANGNTTEFFNGRVADFEGWATDVSANLLDIYNSKIKNMPLQISSSNLKILAPLDQGSDGSAMSTSAGFYKDIVGGNNGTGTDANGNSLNYAEQVLAYA